MSVAARREFDVFVEIPYSPKPFPPEMSSVKRKPSHPQDSLLATKKPKLLDQNSLKERTNINDAVSKVKANVDASSEFPNGHLYCHQCNKKRDPTLVIQCTSPSPRSGRLCKIKYCKPCMLNRYGQDIESIKSKSKAKPGTKFDYTFECPKCQGICNCRACRKAQGLEPTGNLTLAARKAGTSAAQLLHANPDRLGILPGKGQQVIPDKKPTVRKIKIPDTLTSAAAKPKPERRVKVRSSIHLPQLVWSRTLVPSEMPFEEVETRMFIREFMMRFSDIIDKDARTELDDLDEVVGDGSIERCATDIEDSDAEEDDEGQVLVSWVSQTCVKSIFTGLLGLLADCVDSSQKKQVNEALKEVRNSGANLTKIWSSLANLRKHCTEIDFPDPLPPPSSMPTYHTRRGAVLDPSSEGIPVSRSAQLTPIMVSLIEYLMQSSKALKTEIDGRGNEDKEIIRQTKEAIQKENERWKTLKTSKEKTGAKLSKADHEAHKVKLSDLEEVQRMVAYSSTLRFAPIGTDDEGRVYYALSPGLTERESAAALINGDAPKKPRRRGGPGGSVYLDEEERKRFIKWSWFVAVWGKIPEGATIAAEEGEDIETDDGEEKWWGFWEPEKIRELALWITIRNGLDESAEDQTDDSSVAEEDFLTIDDDMDEVDDAKRVPRPLNKDLKSLVNRLDDFANILSWRAQRGERMRKMELY